MLKIDHVTIAGSVLEPMRQAWAEVGLVTDYGGPHSNGVTHMALLGFDDSSYIELISSLRPGQVDPIFWGRHIADDGGACAWAVVVDDVAAEAARVAALGIPVDGPHYYHRQRPDGALVEWDLAFLGDKGAGAQLPFLIKDITPRSWRVQPSTGVAGGPLEGVAKVILGVEDLPATIDLFQSVYGWPPPALEDSPEFGARLADFSGTPVILAEPLGQATWLARRLAHFGESPCGYLLGARDFAATRAALPLSPDETWLGYRTAWFDPVRFNPTRLGVIERV